MRIKKEVVKKLGKKLKEEREKKGYSREELVEDSGLTVNMKKRSALNILMGLENGNGLNNYFRLEAFMRFANVLEMNIYELFDLPSVINESTNDRIENAYNKGVKIGSRIKLMEIIRDLRVMYFKNRHKFLGLLRPSTRVLSEILDKLNKKANE